VKPTGQLRDTILLADDEPYNLLWVAEFLESRGYKVVQAETVDAALSRLTETLFRAVVADLAIPVSEKEGGKGPVDPVVARYPGLRVAEYARNQGHRGRQVIVYSVYDEPEVEALAAKMGYTYLLKGRPRQFKEELAEVLAYDPSLAAGQTEGSRVRKHRR
jgi:CheY-like chemotaxis protein